MKALSKNYLKTQIETASKPQLLLLLFDGAIRFAERAKSDLAEKNFEGSYNGLVRAQRIVVELLSALDATKIPPELYKNLTGLYAFVYRRLVAANMERRAESIDEAVSILRHLRETWVQAIEKMDPETKKSLSRETAPPMEARSLSVRG
ncbi:MAG: flagellar export chaperone FliS [Planctomycetes bacterium]|nr:flagellar export chaperone FliS [Planctomycetota bacterium]